MCSTYGRCPVFKLQHCDDKGLWHNVLAEDGKPLTFTSEADARAELAKRFPVAVQMEKYAGPKTARVVVADPYKDVDDERDS
jgi:hypothetical protein